MSARDAAVAPQNVSARPLAENLHIATIPIAWNESSQLTVFVPRPTELKSRPVCCLAGGFRRLHSGRVAHQQLAGNLGQIRVRERVEAGRHAFALGAIDSRLWHAQRLAKLGQHGVGAGILQVSYQGL